MPNDARKGSLRWHPMIEPIPWTLSNDDQHMLRQQIIAGKRPVIETWRGLMLTGRAAWNLCQEQGVRPTFVDMERDVDRDIQLVDSVAVARHVLSAHRATIRALPPCEQYVVVARITEAVREMAHDNTQASLRGDVVTATFGPVPRFVHQNLGLDFSERTLRRLQRIVRTGVPELIDALRRGRISANQASQWAKLPAHLQRAKLGPSQPVVPIATTPPPQQRAQTNLSPRLDVFVGRGEALRELDGMFDGPWRLVTLAGPAGCGKTRLAWEYGLRCRERMSGGVFFCDLTEARSGSDIMQSLARTLDVPLTSRDHTQQLAHVLAHRPATLVILDNFEQLTEHSPTLHALLAGAPPLRVLVTSRQRLDLPGEGLYDLAPLSLPTDRRCTEDILSSEAVQLFCARARAMNHRFEIQPTNAADIAALVELLDGLPLAIELAAARLRTMTPGQMLERMNRRFDLLRRPRARRTERQGTLKQAIDWSWELLEPFERSALAQLAVFEGGFTLDKVEAVLDLSAWPDAPPIVDVMSALVDRSLVRDRVATAAPKSLGLLASIQAYAREKLDDASVSPHLRSDNVHQRHGRAYATLGTPDAIEALYTRARGHRRADLHHALTNLRMAAQRARAAGDAEILTNTLCAAFEVNYFSGPFAQADEEIRQGLTLRSLSPLQRSRLMGRRALLLRRQGRLDEALDVVEDALLFARSAHDRVQEGRWRGHQGVILRQLGDVTQAERCYRDALEIAREVGHRRHEGIWCGHLAQVAKQRGSHDRAAQGYLHALQIAREVGDQRHEGVWRGNQANLDMEQGRVGAAREGFQAALTLARQAGDRRLEGMWRGSSAIFDGLQGDPVLASEGFDEALQIAREVGDRRLEGAWQGALAVVAGLQGRFAEARRGFEDALAVAQATSDRPREGAWVGALALLDGMEGRIDLAQVNLTRAHVIAQELGDRMRARLWQRSQSQLHQLPVVLKLLAARVEQGTARHGRFAQPPVALPNECEPVSKSYFWFDHVMHWINPPR